MNSASFVAWTHTGAPSRPATEADATSASGSEAWVTRRHGAITLRARGRAPLPGATAVDFIVHGDASEFDPSVPEATLAGGVTIRHDAVADALVVVTSLVALPPVFLCRAPGVVALSSDIHLLSSVPGVRLAFDPLGVSELARLGHPVGHRTLFKDVELVPGGSRLVLRADGGVTVSRVWDLPEAAPLTWPEFIERQMAAFERSVRRMDVAGSFLSLTAGLDTRTIFAVLAEQHRLIPAATMTGPHASLDARTSRRLCDAYGIPHQSVTIGGEFIRSLPRFVTEASRLSGGLDSLGQAPEVFLYASMGSRFTGRISGNLGNQVGRGGTEGVSVRGADAAILGAAYRGPAPEGHWLLDEIGGDARARTRFIMQQEIAFTLAGNFTVGNHFATQRSPYASRELIENLAHHPVADGTSPSYQSKLAMRVRDLRHRFLGEPVERSFQRSLVRRANGFAARCPVNWGWRPVGGVSPVGLMWGAATLAGMASRAAGLDAGVMQRPLAWTGLPSLHDFRENRRWLLDELEGFVRDSVSTACRTAPTLFEPAALGRLLDEHFSRKRDHYHSVTLALDLALAQVTLVDRPTDARG